MQKPTTNPLRLPLAGVLVTLALLAGAGTVISSPDDTPADPKSSMASDGIGLVTSAQTSSVAADQGLVAQFRTWLSVTIEKINTFPPTGLLLFFR